MTRQTTMPSHRKKRKSVDDGDDDRGGDDLSRLEAGILSIVERDRPETVERLIKLVEAEYGSSEEEVMKHIRGLQSKDKLLFRGVEPASYASAWMYVSSRQAHWYWLVMGLSLATVVSVFGVPENMFPLVYARYVLGSLFVLFLPGYSFIKALFPRQLPVKTGSGDLDTIERLALSVGMSLALI